MSQYRALLIIYKSAFKNADDEDKPNIRFTNAEQIKRQGGDTKIREEGRKLYGLGLKPRWLS